MLIKLSTEATPAFFITSAVGSNTFPVTYQLVTNEHKAHVSLRVSLLSNKAEESLFPFVVSTIRYAMQWILVHDALYNKSTIHSQSCATFKILNYLNLNLFNTFNILNI
jgi:hypothetical protein